MTCSQIFDLFQKLAFRTRQRDGSASTLNPKRQKATVEARDRMANSGVCGGEAHSLRPTRLDQRITASRGNRGSQAFVPLLFFFALSAGAVVRAADLGVAWVDVAPKLQDAAARAGVEPVSNAMDCIGEYPSTCRWDVGDGVDMVATNDGSGKLVRIEAGWSNTRANSGPASADTFRGVCMAIAALVHPGWTKQRVARIVTAIMIVRPSRKDADERQSHEGGVLLFGDRNVPDKGMASRPDEAFVQCGAVAE